MPHVEIVNVEDRPTIQLGPGQRLVLALEDAGIDILHRCGGNARCTTCRVEILSGDPGPMTEAEAARLAREENLAPNTRLACQIAAIQSDLTINVINRLATSGLEDPGPRPIEW